MREVFSVSVYSVWESPYLGRKGSWIFADASAHRLISDISGLVARQNGHRIIAAGDLNSLYGHGENRSPYWAARYQTIFDRFASIGLVFVGLQSPNGRQAEPDVRALNSVEGWGPSDHCRIEITVRDV